MSALKEIDLDLDLDLFPSAGIEASPKGKNYVLLPGANPWLFYLYQLAGIVKTQTSPILVAQDSKELVQQFRRFLLAYTKGLKNNIQGKEPSLESLLPAFVLEKSWRHLRLPGYRVDSGFVSHVYFLDQQKSFNELLAATYGKLYIDLVKEENGFPLPEEGDFAPAEKAMRIIANRENDYRTWGEKEPVVELLKDVKKATGNFYGINPENYGLPDIPASTGTLGFLVMVVADSIYKG